MANVTAYKVGGFMAWRLVCASCATPVFRRIKMGLSETVPRPQESIATEIACADCGKNLAGGNRHD